MTGHGAIEQGEGLTKSELGEALPPRVRFQKTLDMAQNALSVADVTRELLAEEVSAANAELEAAGKLGRKMSVKTPEYFRRRSEEGVEKPLVNEGYAYATHSLFREVSGVFEGLTIVDTATVEYARGELDLMRGDQPDRLVICGAFSDTEQARGATTYVPHMWLEGPEHGMMNIRGVAGRVATPMQPPETTVQ